MLKQKFEGYDVEYVRNIPKRKVSINGRIDSRDYLELALEATKTYNQEFPDEKFDVKNSKD